MNKTSIEWTDSTWNPIRGCSRVSEGCCNCYAEKVAYRFSEPGQPYEGLVRIDAAGERHPQWNGQVRLVEKHLLDPLRWGDVQIIGKEKIVDGHALRVYGSRRRRIFVNSMSDLFHENVPDEWIDLIFGVMAICPQHQFQILTKRPERMKAYFEGLMCDASAEGRAMSVCAWIAENATKVPEKWIDLIASILKGLPNVWLGVSVENQKAADERIPLLLQTPAAVRFVSAEPLLGPVNLNRLEIIDGEVDNSDPEWPTVSGYCIDALNGRAFDDENGELSTAQDGEVPIERGLNWVIVGGESGPGARPMHPNWVRSLRVQCQAADVPFFFKQWGEWGPYRKDQNTYGSPNLVQTEAGYKKRCMHVQGPDGTSAYMQRVGRKAAGALLDGREWHEFPEVKL